MSSFWCWPTCIDPDHRFVLRGVSGSGAGSTTVSAAHLGGRAGHVSQELGIPCSLTASTRPTVTPMSSASTSGCTRRLRRTAVSSECQARMPGREALDPQNPDHSGYDCRDPEHYVLGLLEDYRLNGDEFRAEIAAENGTTRKARLRAQYLWIKTNWFRGVEFKRGAAAGANLTIDGLQCLRDECPLE